MGLLNEYITVTKKELKNHFYKINYVQKCLVNYSKTCDGFWIRKIESGYEFFEHEREIEFKKRFLKNEEDVLNVSSSSQNIEKRINDNFRLRRYDF